MVHFPDRAPASGQTAVRPTSGTLDVLRERVRQIEKGYDAAHDDTWDESELALAALTHLLWHCVGRHGRTDAEALEAFAPSLDALWPWPCDEFKPADGGRAQLVMVAALLLAEIDRRDRATAAIGAVVAAVAAGAEG